MKKVMFVCTGNICRSAMAHGILEKLAREKGKEIEVYSCGTSAVSGEGATYSSIEALKEYDVDITSHKSTHILESNIEEMDLILCATENHKRYISQIYPGLKDRIYTMKEYADSEEKDKDIRDPFGYDIETYRNCCKIIYETIEKTLDKI